MKFKLKKKKKTFTIKKKKKKQKKSKFLQYNVTAAVKKGEGGERELFFPEKRRR